MTRSIAYCPTRSILSIWSILPNQVDIYFILPNQVDIVDMVDIAQPDWYISGSRLFMKQAYLYCACIWPNHVGKSGQVSSMSIFWLLATKFLVSPVLLWYQLCEFRKREMWRFLTYSLLHSSWWHLTFNLVVQVSDLPDKNFISLISWWSRCQIQQIKLSAFQS